MRVACPKCGAPTEILPEDFGRQIKCYDCQSMIGVDGGGNVSLAAAAPPQTSERPKRSDLMADRGSSGGSMGSSAMSILGSIMFTIGALLVVLFLFLPLIDMTNLMTKQSSIELGATKLDREVNREIRKLDGEQRELDKQTKKLNEEERKPNADAKDINKRRGELNDKYKELDEKRAEAKAAYEKRDKWEKEKDTLQTAMDDGRAAASTRRPWYTMGMMAGFLFVAAGAISYLTLPGTARRVTGCIVICAEIQIIFLMNAFGYPKY
jgi:hypothetical protein